MLPKENRLTDRKDFNKIFKQGKGFFAETIGVKSTLNGFNYSRFGITVSNKVSKKAVIRNKLRRQIREIIHKNLGKIKPGFDILIICQPGIEKKEFKEIESRIIKILTKIRLI